MSDASERRSRAKNTSWKLGTGLAAFLAVGLILLFLLTQSTNNNAVYEAYFDYLVALNIAAALGLATVVGWLLFRLWQRWHQGRFGSQLLVKLVVIFTLVGVLPGGLIYVVSYQFVSRSIESWFDVRVESALTSGLNLGRTAIDMLRADTSRRVKSAAQELAAEQVSVYTLQLERLREQMRATDVAVLSQSGQVLASATESSFSFNVNIPKPSAVQISSARDNGVSVQVLGLDGSPGVRPALQALAWMTPKELGLQGESHFLQVSLPLSAELVADALAVQEANREYQERSLARDGLRRMYIGTLTLTLFLAVFGAVLVGALLGAQLAQPLLLLAAGVRDVAKGDLTPKLISDANDELGGLTRSFADMTQQLADARTAVQHSVTQLDAARANLQTILDNLTAGVLVLDSAGVIQSANPSAGRILGLSADTVGQALAALPGLSHWAQSVAGQFKTLGAERYERAGHAGVTDRSAPAADDTGPMQWQQSFELDANAYGVSHDHVTLLARGALLPDQGQLLVFDDISDLVSAQRSKAWADVARRLAHEIKNPLTPIQLSAERLGIKLKGKLAAADDALLERSVNTIVEQVEAMQRLVNEFRDYARLPSANLAETDLNRVLHDILNLYEHAVCPVVFTPCADGPLIWADASQLRQVIHNLVQNAQDASQDIPGVQVRLRTELDGAGEYLRLIVADSGPGFPESILKRAFEPYVTTKAKGTGLGLAVVKKIADEHHATVRLTNRMQDNAVIGGQVSLSFPVAGKHQ